MSAESLSAHFKGMSGLVEHRLDELDPKVNDSYLLSSRSEEGGRRMFVFVAWAEEGSPRAERFARGLDDVRGAD